MSTVPVSVVIPTIDRGPYLVGTLRSMLAQTPAAREILVVDQTRHHDRAVRDQLEAWHAVGAIRWLRQNEPSVPAAMNRGLLEAREDIVLFLDDDVIPSADLVGCHARNHAGDGVSAIVGQVLQPGQAPRRASSRRSRDGIWRDLDFSFDATERRIVANCMAGNLSVRRERALACGGFDERFVGVAYRFETEFCRRLARSGGEVVFCPDASLRHLRAPTGGTRRFGDPLRSARPEHSVGDYYFSLRESAGAARWRYIGQRMARSVLTRFHLRHPWWIPVKLVGELRGLALAVRLRGAGPAYVMQSTTE